MSIKHPKFVFRSDTFLKKEKSKIDKLFNKEDDFESLIFFIGTLDLWQKQAVWAYITAYSGFYWRQTQDFANKAESLRKELLSGFLDGDKERDMFSFANTEDGWQQNRGGFAYAHFVNGSQHRLDGPAYYCSDGTHHWHLNGVGARTSILRPIKNKVLIYPFRKFDSMIDKQKFINNLIASAYKETGEKAHGYRFKVIEIVDKHFFWVVDIDKEDTKKLFVFEGEDYGSL